MSYFVPSLTPTTSSQAFNTVMTSLSPKTLCREHVIHNHPYGVNFNDSVCCLSHPMGTQRLIYFLSRVGFTFATDLSIFTGTKVYAKIPKSSTSIIHLCKGAYRYHSNLYWATRYLSVKYVTSAANERRLAETMWQGHPSTVCL